MNDLEKVQELLDIVRGWRTGEVTPYMRAQVQRFGARLDAARRNDPSASMRAALNGFRDLSMSFWAAVTSLELTEWLLSEGRDAEAAPLADEARKTFELLRATPWLQRLDSCGVLDAIAQAT
jgi:hypothetical protein